MYFLTLGSILVFTAIVRLIHITLPFPFLVAVYYYYSIRQTFLSFFIRWHLFLIIHPLVVLKEVQVLPCLLDYIRLGLLCAFRLNSFKLILNTQFFYLFAQKRHRQASLICRLKFLETLEQFLSFMI